MCSPTGKLLEGVAEAEAALAPWMPAARLAQLSERRKQLSALLAQLQAGLLRPSGGECAAQQHALPCPCGSRPGKLCLLPCLLLTNMAALASACSPSAGAPLPRAGIAACAFCGKLAPAGQLRTCGSCKRVRYCSRECQVGRGGAGLWAVSVRDGGKRTKRKAEGTLL